MPDGIRAKVSRPPADLTAKARTGSSMFLTRCGPRSSKRDGKGLAHVLLGCRRQANATGPGECLKPGGNVDAVPEQIAALHHHVAHMHPDPEVQAPGLRQRVIGGRQRLLGSQRTRHRVDGTGELGQHAVSRRVGDPPPVFGNEAVKDGAMGRQRLKGRRLILSHEAGVGFHVCREDGGQPALHNRDLRSDGSVCGSAHEAGRVPFRPCDRAT